MLFYLIAPIPLAIARKCGSDDYISQESSALLHEICYFLSACIVVSGFGLPFVLARRHVVSVSTITIIIIVFACDNNSMYVYLFSAVVNFLIPVCHADSSWCWSTDSRSQFICVWNYLFLLCVFCS